MRFCISLLFTIFFLLSPEISPASSLKLITGNWEPYSSSDPEKPGITTEIVRAAFDAVGIETTLTFYPWARCEKMIQRGMDVVAFPYVQTAERDKFALFSKPILTERTYLYYSKRHMKDFDFTDYKSLRKYRIGTLNGFVHQEFFKKNNVPATAVKDNTSALRMLLMNRLQLFPINSLVAEKELKKNFSVKKDEIRHTKTPMYEVPLKLMVSNLNPQAHSIFSQFSKGMSILRRKGTVDKILKKYK